MTIKAIREKTGLSQSEAAKRLKISVSFWNRVEAGIVDLPPKHLKKAAKLLQVPVAKLVELRVTKFKSKLSSQVQ